MVFKGWKSFFPAFLFYMKSKFIFSLFFIFIFIPVLHIYAVTKIDIDVEAALSSAESLFKTMKSQNYQKIWSLLTEKSKEVIVNDVYKAETNSGAGYSKENIYNDFNSGSSLSQSYWISFLENFNPDTVLEQSKWDIGKFEKNKGEIIIQYRKAQKPAILKMFKEDNKWKTGLVETFWTRKQ